MDIPKAIFVNNKDTEIQRLIHTAKQIWSGFYVKRGFKILAYPTKLDSSSIYFPDTGFTKISNIANKLKRIKLDFPIKYSNTLSSQIKFKYEPINLNTYQESWKRVEKDFWQTAHTLYPIQTRLIMELEIRITRYGSISSFQFLQKNKPGKIIVYLRMDANISYIAEAILICLANYQTQDYEKLWEENKHFVSNLMLKTKLATLFPEYRPAKLSANSKYQKYIKDLGIQIPTGLSIQGHKIYLNNKLISNLLTKSQFLILKYMLQNERYFIDHQNIADLIWNNPDEKFSNWAIEKIMQRLKSKLILLGANPDWLKTSRGRGYLLENV